MSCVSPAATGYVEEQSYKWIQNNALMYKGDNASDCMVHAYIAGANKIISGIKFYLLPACTDALEKVSMCLEDGGDRCAPNMDDFALVANALSTINDFYKKINIDRKSINILR